MEYLVAGRSGDERLAGGGGGYKLLVGGLWSVIMYYKTHRCR